MPINKQKSRVDGQESYIDRSIAHEMSKAILSNPKMDGVYQKISGDKNADGSTGMLLAQSIIGIRDKMIQAGMLSDDNIWAAENGVLDHMIKDVQSNLKTKINPEKTRAAAVQVLQEFDQAGQKAKTNGTAQQQQQPNQQGQPPAPQMPMGPQQQQQGAPQPPPSPMMGMPNRPQLGPTS